MGVLFLSFSHCWSYKLRDLITLLMRHYDAQPGTAGGRVYQPLYYWRVLQLAPWGKLRFDRTSLCRVDIFAVQQNFKGDFKDHPDSDFPAVIRATQVGRKGSDDIYTEQISCPPHTQAVLFTIMPWRAPLCVERVWWVVA